MGVPIQLIDIDVPFAWQPTVRFDEAFCAAQIAAAEARGWHPGTVNGQGGRTVRPERRDVEVSFWDDPSLAAWLTESLARELPPTMKGAPLVGIRANLRLYRYGPDQFFGLHRDQKYRAPGLVSHLGLLVYLDEPKQGGDTWFAEAGLRVRPSAGRAVLFQNATLHAGEPVQEGRKHVLRADVMYRDDGGS